MRKNSRRHSKPCVYYQTNTCPLSAEECDYAHVLTTAEQYEKLKNPQATRRTKPCRFYLAGQCKDGYWCRFKHPASLFASSVALSEAELHDDMPELESDKSGDDDVDVRDLDGAWRAKPEQHPKYRTRPCRNYLLGKCIYGDHCSYLHAAFSSSSPTSSVSSPPATYASSYFPLTPPPNRVPNSMPISAFPESDVDIDTSMEIDKAVPASMANAGSDHRTRTPSNSSSRSQPTDEPATPAGSDYYATVQPAPYGFPAFPLSPLSPPVRSPHFVHKMQSTFNLALPPTPPYTMYSPTSPVPMAIVHVPVAVPLFQSPQCESRKSSIGVQRERLSPRAFSQRAFSQPNVDPGKFAQRNAYFRSKPCKFYTEFGRCNKGNSCNFVHSPSPLSRRPIPLSESIEIEDSEEPIQRPPSPPSEKSSNFHKINWRVVGGGVKMASEKSTPRRHSEDTSAISHQRPVFRDPFSPSYGQSSRSPLGAPIDLAEHASSLRTPPNEKPPDFPAGGHRRSKQESTDNALALTLQSFSFAGASLGAGTDAPAQPIIIVQDANEEQVDWEDEYDDDADDDMVIMMQALSAAEPMTPTRYGAARARSSPSSPTNTHLELMNLMFAAESP